MVAARRVHAHPLGRQRHRCLSDLCRRRRAVLRPATGPLGQLYAAAIQRHVPVYRKHDIITYNLNKNEKEDIYKAATIAARSLGLTCRMFK